MKHHLLICCIHCQGSDLRKNGKSSTGIQQWYCKSCGKYFQLHYTYEAKESDIESKIIEMTLNGNGVRNIGRILKISKDTVVAILKRNIKQEPLLSYFQKKHLSTLLWK